jgi:dTDP-4-dehydrorhamnose 3,5-epimerase
MGFRFENTEIPGVVVVHVDRFEDQRGEFSETYRASAFAEAGFPAFVQDNRSRSVERVLRGLHFQRPPHAQGKLVSAVTGAILDVAVDLRRDATTFGRFVAVELTVDNGRMLYVPPGFAHGFYVLQGAAVVAYKQTAEYAPEAEGGLAWNDPRLGIPWPDPDPILSDKDGCYPTLEELLTTFPRSAAHWMGENA